MESCDGVVASLTPGQSSQIVGDGREPVATGTTLTGALVSQVTSDPGCLDQPAGSASEHHNDPDAGRSADRPQRD